MRILAVGRNIIYVVLIIAGLAAVLMKPFYEVMILKKMLARVTADTRIAEVLVTAQHYDSTTKKNSTTIKFVEFAGSKPLAPRYFTFPDNLIQFQSLVIRFDDVFVEHADALRGKSVYFFWKVFMLDGKNTVAYELNSADAATEGYKIYTSRNPFEAALWRRFWRFAKEQDSRRQEGIKNVQVEAPGTRFIPGMLYTLKIEHDGGIRIDSSVLPEILRGELIPG